MNKVNNIIICRNTYKSQDDFEDAIKKAIMVLLNNNYIMTIKYDEPGLGIVSIDYNSADASYGDIYPYWLTAEQADSIMLSDIE